MTQKHSLDRSLGFVRIGVASSLVNVANPMKNVEEIALLTKRAEQKDVSVLCFQELGVTGYSCEDLFHQKSLRRNAIEALHVFCQITCDSSILSIVGLPVEVDGQLFNCAVFCLNGKILGIVPKTYLAGNDHFYESRWFSPANQLVSKTVRLFGDDQEIPIGTDLMFVHSQYSNMKIAAEICEDGWAGLSPSLFHALAGATIIFNLSASNSEVGKSAYRRDMVVRALSGRCVCAYAYAAAGPGESTGDVVWDNHCMIAQNGEICAESSRFDDKGLLLMADIDTERLVHDRIKWKAFGQQVLMLRNMPPYREIQFNVPVLKRIRSFPSGSALHDSHTTFLSKPNPTPFVPSDPSMRDEVCRDIFSHMVSGLGHRLAHVRSRIPNIKVTIGISGGRDSTLALLATMAVFKKYGWNRDGILPITMPGPGTVNVTKSAAVGLMNALELTWREINITPETEMHLRAIGHEPCWDCLQCENAQARVRTTILKNLGFMIGTGDLSELAVGWCTEGADQSGHYNPMCDVPKTLVEYVLRWVADTEIASVSHNIHCVLRQAASPELRKSKSGKIEQKTDDVLGPAILRDFFLHAFLRNGFSPLKIWYLASAAFEGTYSPSFIRKYLEIFFLRRGDNHFKCRTAPDGPKIGSVSLGRYDHRMQADVDLRSCLCELDHSILPFAED